MIYDHPSSNYHLDSIWFKSYYVCATVFSAVYHMSVRADAAIVAIVSVKSSIARPT